jgi:hypothetical protein
MKKKITQSIKTITHALKKTNATIKKHTHLLVCANIVLSVFIIHQLETIKALILSFETALGPILIGMLSTVSEGLESVGSEVERVGSELYRLLEIFSGTGS